MTTGLSEEKHVKHADLKKPSYGNFGRLELAILGAPCFITEGQCKTWASLLADKKIAYIDAEHGIKTEDRIDFHLTLSDKVNYQQFNFKDQPNSFKNRVLFNDADLVLVNGNHFTASKQIVIIHPQKTVENKLDKLTGVVLILLSEGSEIPGYLKEHFRGTNIPMLALNDLPAIKNFFNKLIDNTNSTLKGLILAGGKSTRMQTDKGSIAYHGKSQRAHSFELLAQLCDQVFISGKQQDGYPVIEDTFINLGPFGGILSAMQRDPNAAWLAIACDMPYLSQSTVKYLIENRNPSKIATAFFDGDGKFPEPLVTIWEPRAYPVMLQFLSQGYSCPRKVLINTDIELLTASDVNEFRNINLPHERDEALRFFGVK